MNFWPARKKVRASQGGLHGASPKEQLRKPPEGWRYYSGPPYSRKDIGLGSSEHRRWLLIGGELLATVASVVAISSVLLILYLSGWLSFGQAPLIIGLILTLAAAFAILIVLGYRQQWTGFRDKKLWNWMQLLVIPLVLAAGGTIFTWVQHSHDQAVEDLRKDNELAIQKQRDQDAAVQTYLDDISKLLLDKDQPLLKSSPGSNVASIATAKTLTVLNEMGSSQTSLQHKGSILQFLQSARLLNSDRPIISLRNANLKGATLSTANLSSANLSEAELNEADLSDASLHNAVLSGANLHNANLRNAHLSETPKVHAARLDHADLSGANLSGADLGGVDLSESILNGADLSRANLKSARVTQEQLDTARSLKGATLPDGSIHD